jgi:hypothetical protein
MFVLMEHKLFMLLEMPRRSYLGKEFQFKQAVDPNGVLLK